MSATTSANVCTSAVISSRLLLLSVPLSKYVAEKQSQLEKKCPAPIAKKLQIRPEYFLFSANSFAQSERAWTEIKDLVFYTLRFWLRPPLTDEGNYYPKAIPIETPVAQ